MANTSDILQFKIFPKEMNDMYPFDELFLTTHIEQHINLQNWDNASFGIFICNIKSNTSSTFTYLLNNEKVIWYYNSNSKSIQFDIANKISNLVNQELIVNLLNLYTSINNFKTACSRSCDGCFYYLN